MERTYEIGVIGLGVMGAALAKNMIRHGFRTALYSVSEKERRAFNCGDGVYGAEMNKTGICETADTLETFVRLLAPPRKIFLMITAGEPVDAVIGRLLPLLDRGDIIMDGGNSYYKDTNRRFLLCEKAGIQFLGIGVSGGEQGALEGPSMMAGGSREGWEQSRQILQTIAASFEGRPCCEYIAGGGAGHYVKMVHNGIEYAILELMAETYEFLRFVKGLEPEQVRGIFEQWNEGKLNSYLMELSALVLGKQDEDGALLLDRILDTSEQKGTGKWTVLESVERGVYTPTIYAAQALRAFSQDRKARLYGAKRLPLRPLMSPDISVDEAEDALFLAIVISYSQGLELIAKASREEHWGIDLPRLAGVWKNGCIIRSRLLEEIEETRGLEERPLLLSERFTGACEMERPLRKLVSAAAASGSTMPGFCSALQYYDVHRAARLPLNFVQALRDCFGAHTYRRTDREGSFHTEWQSPGHPSSR